LAFGADRASHDNVTAAFYSALADDDPDELYDNAPCAYLSALPDGTNIKANATFLAWTGYDRDALVGRLRFQDLLPRVTASSMRLMRLRCCTCRACSGR
jgi:PAS domain-containing protein